MTTDEIAQVIKTLYEKKKMLDDISSQRRQEEADLVMEYKVDECNQKRNAMVAKYSALTQSVFTDIKNLEDSLGN